MGLPLFVAPIEPEEAAKNADKAAARSRSTIRRQRAVRRPAYPSGREDHGVRTPHEGPSIGIIPDHVPDFSDIVSPTQEAEVEAIRARLAASRRLRDTARGLPHPSVIRRSDTHRVPRSPRDHPPSPPQLRADAPPVPHVNVTSNTPPMPPVPESRDFQARRRPILYARRGRGRPWADYRRSSHSNQIEPHLTLSRRETVSDLGTSSSAPQLPALTPNFSPAYRYTLEESRDRPRSNSPPQVAYNPSYSVDAERQSSLSGVQSPPHDLRSLRELPPLRRMDRHSVGDMEARRLRLRAARLDGLGDRDRSLSPDGEGAWETMLTTLTPDPQLPSAGSSFASGSAATSASSTSDSQGTSLTTMSSTRNESAHVSAAIDNACDVLENSDSSVMSDTEIEDEEDIYELQDNLDDRERFHRSYADVVASRENWSVRHHGGADSDHLGSLQRIVRRLARREDIPDEWWAEAGLSRTLPA